MEAVRRGVEKEGEREGREEEGGGGHTHKHTDTHAGKNGTENRESERWGGGRVTARKCVEKRRRATCKARRNEKLPLAKYLAKKHTQKKSLASVLESKKAAGALTRCKREAAGDGALLFSRGKIHFEQS